MHDPAKPAAYRTALRIACITAGIAIADLLLLANHLMAHAVQPEAYDDAIQTLITTCLSVALPAVPAVAGTAYGYAWTYTVWPDD